MVTSGRWFESGRNRRKGRNKRNKRRAYKTLKGGEEKKTFHVRLSEGHKAFHGAAEGARGGRGGEIYCR